MPTIVVSPLARRGWIDHAVRHDVDPSHDRAALGPGAFGDARRIVASLVNALDPTQATPTGGSSSGSLFGVGTFVIAGIVVQAAGAAGAAAAVRSRRT